MKANELRIGNIIACDIESLVIKAIGQETITCISSAGQKHIFLDSNFIFGLKLTEEWLLKFGFVKRDNYFHIEHSYFDGYAYDLKKYCLTKCYPSAINEFHSSVIEYVHELQNLYFALTGEELTIKE